MVLQEGAAVGFSYQGCGFFGGRSCEEEVSGKGEDCVVRWLWGEAGWCVSWMRRHVTSQGWTSGGKGKRDGSEVVVNCARRLVEVERRMEIREPEFGAGQVLSRDTNQIQYYMVLKTHRENIIRGIGSLALRAMCFLLNLAIVRGLTEALVENWAALECR